MEAQCATRILEIYLPELPLKMEKGAQGVEGVPMGVPEFWARPLLFPLLYALDKLLSGSDFVLQHFEKSIYISSMFIDYTYVKMVYYYL